MITAATEDIRDVDMVIFGFQEIKDPDHLIEKMGKELLWKDDLTSRLEELLEAIAEAIRMPEDVKRSKDAAMEYLNGKDDQFDITTFMAKIEPVIAWAEQVQQQLKRIVFEQYPNFFSAIPARALERLFSMVQTLGTQAQAMKDIDLKASSKGSKVPTRQGTLKKVRDIQLEVSGPVDRAKGSHTPVSRQASRDDTSSVVKDIFSVDSESILRDFKTECGVLQVQAVRQQWHSNPLVCHKFKHYDTMMVVFVNPFSAWRIIADTKPTDSCKRTDDDGSEGCNIDNNKGFRKECGRVVNVLRLKVSKGMDVHYFGALNTHMSLSAETSERAKHVEAAVKEAQDAECDALVFVGDFNSRLHCHRRLQLDDVEPLMSAAGWSKNWQANSLQTVLSTLSTSGNKPDSGQYRLTVGSSRLADEMNQLLDKKHEQVKCFEGKQVKEFHNNVSSLGLLEGDLDFNPTYRLGTEEFAKKKGTGFYQPVEGMKKCYYNPSGEPKNNPAWPDRVLRWSKEAALFSQAVTQAIVTELTEDAKANTVVLAIPDDHKPFFSRGNKVKVTCPDGNVHSTTVSGGTGVIVLSDPFAQKFPKGSKVNAEVLVYKSVETLVKEYKSVETTIGSDHAPVIATVGYVFRTLPPSRARPLPDKPV
jgi:RNAse (barnase) inhibitor barstar